MKYEAFISYRHREIDEVVAKHVQKIIERYRVPKKIADEIGRTHIGKVFRDSDELQAASNLSQIIRDAIEQSEWLIIICTKRYKDSVWCMEEVEHFVELNGREKVLVILVEGEPYESFPSILTEIEVDGKMVHIEPLAVDIRGDSERAIIKNLNNERFRFLSSILQVDYDDLKNRQRERRIRLIATAAGIAFAIMTGVTGVIVKKNIDLYKSNQATLRGESYFLSEYADEAFLEGDRDTALKLALTALPKDLKKPDRPYVPRVMKTLTQATGVYDLTAGYHEEYVKVSEESPWNSFTSFSEDGSSMLIERYIQVEQTYFKREFEVVRVSDGVSLYQGTELDAIVEITAVDNTINPCPGAVLSGDGSRVYFLSEEGFLTCVDVLSGEKVFTVDTVSVGALKVVPSAAPGQLGIITIDYFENNIYGYDPDGNEIFATQLSLEYYYDPGLIDNKTGRLPLITEGDTVSGFSVMDLKTGDITFYKTENSVSSPVFTGNDLVTYLTHDEKDGLSHIAQYDLRTGKQEYICDTDRDIKELILSDNRDLCYYFHDDTFCAVNCTGSSEPVWEQVLPSEITTLRVGGGMVAAGMKNGSVAVFSEAGMNQLPTPSGSGEAVNVGSVTKTAYTTIGSKEQYISVYLDHGAEYYKDIQQVSTADIGGGVVEEHWFNVPTQSGRFLFGKDKGEKSWLAVYDAGTLEKLSEIELTEMLGENDMLENLRMISDDHFELLTYNSQCILDASSMKEAYSADRWSTYTYLSEDGKLLYENSVSNVAEDGSYDPSGVVFRTIEISTGNVLEERVLPDGVYKAVRIGDRMILDTADSSISIEGPDGTTEATLEESYLYSVNEARGLLFYNYAPTDTWRVYDVEKGKLVCELEPGLIPNLIFFGNNRYLLKDYEEVYDMDTWQCVLSLKPENGQVSGAQTTDGSPYFVIVCTLNGTESACLYEKDGNGEPVGVVNNFVGMAPDGDIITYNGDQTLFKFPLLSIEEIKEKAEIMVGDAELTPEQKEKYHLFR